MALSAFRVNSSFLSACAERGLLKDFRLSLLDVGCSGGIDSFWDQFGAGFRAVGFDPLVSEVERLNAAVAGRDIRYVAAWIGEGKRALPDSVRIEPGLDIDPVSAFGLSSAQRAMDKTGVSFTEDVFNSGAELVFAEQRVSVDEWLDANDFGPVDVVKCDVDGFDFEVFVGAEKLLSAPDRPLALITEAQLHEMRDRHGTVWGDLDRLLRDRGYRLFDVDIHRYTRGALPGQFEYSIFAQTVDGPAMFCDALYLLDPVMDSSAMDELIARNDPGVFLRLILLYESFGLPDCAAALIVALRDKGIVPPALDVDWALDALVPANSSGITRYDDYIAAFDKNPRAFFPQAGISHGTVDEELQPGECSDWTAAMQLGEGAHRDWLSLVSEKGHEGHLCFGPYRSLLPGRYLARLQVDLSAAWAQKLLLEVIIDEVTVASHAATVWRPGVRWLQIAFDVPSSPSAPVAQLRLSTEGKARQSLMRVIVRRES